MVKKTKGQKSMNAIIMLFIVGLVAVTLLAPLANEIERVRIGSGNITNPSSNVTGAAFTIVDLVPLFFAIFILIIFVTGMVLRRRG